MNKLGLCGTLLLAIITTPSFAERGAFYVEGKFGGSHGQAKDFEATDVTVEPNHFDENVYVWGGAVGYTYKPWAAPLRMEAEYLYRNHYPYHADESGSGTPTGTSFHQHTNTQTILANFYIDVPLTRMFALFGGGGVGAAMSTTYSTTIVSGVTEETQRNDDNGFSWMGTAGFSVMPVKWMALSLSYRYSGLNGITSVVQSDNFNAQEIMLGLRFMVPDLYGHPTPKPVTNRAPSTLDK